jgi:hypothetical protein
MVGSNEERFKVGLTTFVWRLLEWQMEMKFSRFRIVAQHFNYSFLLSYFEKYNKQKSN